jgi:hypothetical protein
MRKLLYTTLAAAFIFFQFHTAATAQVTIPGNDFEKWQTTIVSQPEGWLTSSLSDPFAEKKSVTKTNDAYHGNSAIRLETIETEYQGQATIMQGFAISGKMDFSGYSIGFPCSKRPRRLSFYYKYAPTFHDSMVVSILLQKSNGSGEPTIIGMGAFLSGQTTTEYTYGTINIEYESEEMPDTALIGIFSGIDTLNAGSVLIIDYLNFEQEADIQQVETPKTLLVGNIFPQPANNHINIPLLSEKSQIVQLEVTDMLGKNLTSVAQDIHSGENTISVPVESWKAGIYLYNIKADGKQYTGKFVVSGK